MIEKLAFDVGHSFNNFVLYTYWQISALNSNANRYKYWTELHHWDFIQTSCLD